MPLPATLIAGDSASWTDEPYVDAAGRRYDAAGYALTYELRGPGAPLTLSAQTDGQGWKTSLTTSASAALTAGLWFWAAILTATGERITIARGQVEVTADPVAQAAGYDGRSQAERALADAETALASFKSSQGKIKKYTIGARSMEFYAAAEILEVISYWRTKVQNERAAKSISDGLGNPKNLMVRFR
mgnify:CR=1 FL=1